MAPKKIPQSPSSSSTGHGSRQDYEREESLLREFDMNMRYGPSHGITRMERYQKAVRERRNPPEIIGKLLNSGRHWTGIPGQAVH